MRYTYNQISEKYNVDKAVLTRAVFALQIKGFVENGFKTFSTAQVKDILEYKSVGVRSKKYDRRKLKIIEFYGKYKSGRRTAIFLNIDRKFVVEALREWRETGCVIVESKLNNMRE